VTDISDLLQAGSLKLQASTFMGEFHQATVAAVLLDTNPFSRCLLPFSFRQPPKQLHCPGISGLAVLRLVRGFGETFERTAVPFMLRVVRDFGISN
jgi:hypothetical protein